MHKFVFHSANQPDVLASGGASEWNQLEEDRSFEHDVETFFAQRGVRGFFMPKNSLPIIMGQLLTFDFVFGDSTQNPPFFPGGFLAHFSKFSRVKLCKFDPHLLQLLFGVRSFRSRVIIARPNLCYTVKSRYNGLEEREREILSTIAGFPL